MKTNHVDFNLLETSTNVDIRFCIITDLKINFSSNRNFASSLNIYHSTFTMNKKKYIRIIRKKLIKYAIDVKNAQYLVHNYGKQTDIILNKYSELKEGSPQEKMIKAEVWYTIYYEMTCSPVDFFMRRTGRAYFDIDSVYENLDLVLLEFSKHLSWKDEELYNKRQELNKVLKLITSFN